MNFKKSFVAELALQWQPHGQKEVPVIKVVVETARKYGWINNSKSKQRKKQISSMTRDIAVQTIVDLRNMRLIYIIRSLDNKITLDRKLWKWHCQHWLWWWRQISFIFLIVIVISLQHLFIRYDSNKNYYECYNYMSKLPCTLVTVKRDFT